MDPILERFRFLLRSMMREPLGGFDSHPHFDDDTSSAGPNRYDTYDYDFKDAWEELDEFLRAEKEHGPVHSKARPQYHYGPPEELRSDYELLSVPFGASFEKVKEGYKKTMRQHHPDVHGSDPDRNKQATSKAQQINRAFQRIRAWETAKKVI